MQLQRENLEKFCTVVVFWSSERNSPAQPSLQTKSVILCVLQYCWHILAEPYQSCNGHQWTKFVVFPPGMSFQSMIHLTIFDISGVCCHSLMFSKVHTKTTHPYYQEAIDNPLAPRKAMLWKLCRWVYLLSLAFPVPSRLPLSMIQRKSFWTK